MHKIASHYYRSPVHSGWGIFLSIILAINISNKSFFRFREFTYPLL
nr:MAG TPA: hypothetical protein [Caudoviricetes sp.]